MKETSKNRKSKALEIVQKFFPQVTNVIDANSSLSIEVTQRDSSNSKLQNHSECALAVACKRKEKADGVLISINSAYVIKGNRATRYKVPEPTAREIVAFDHHGGFTPGSYQLRAPSGSDMIGSPHRGGGHAVTVKKRTYHRTENIGTSLTKS